MRLFYHSMAWLDAILYISLELPAVPGIFSHRLSSLELRRRRPGLALPALAKPSANPATSGLAHAMPNQTGIATHSPRESGYAQRCYASPPAAMIKHGGTRAATGVAQAARCNAEGKSRHCPGAPHTAVERRVGSASPRPAPSRKRGRRVPERIGVVPGVSPGMSFLRANPWRRTAAADTRGVFATFPLRSRICPVGFRILRKLFLFPIFPVP